MDPDKLTVDAYFRLPETLRPMELVYGVVREPPAPFYPHQSVVTRLTALLEPHVTRYQLGRVCVSPIDVVLDRGAALVLQPDLVFVSNERLPSIRDRIWGAPDLTVEVLSPGTAKHDRTFKLDCYRRYGVRETWIIDPQCRSVEVHQFDRAAPDAFRGESYLRSGVLPQLRLQVNSILDV